VSAIRPSELESQVLAVLWERGPSVVRDVQEALPDGRQRAYTTVLTTLQIMERKGLVTHDREGQANVYRPLVTRDQIAQPVVQTLVRNLFGGDATRAVQALLDSSDLSAAELKEIRRMINEAARDKKTDGQ
jgi:predicted transcriptional regulator